MAAEQRKLLEQLMGADALVGRPSKRQETPITDSRVCKSYLVGTCPHDLFTNTKTDLGPCPRIHSEAHKAEFQREKERLENGGGNDGRLTMRDLANFEMDYYRDLEKYVTDCNRRIDVAQRRLERTPDEIAQTTTILKAIDEINESIDASIFELQVLGDLALIPRALQEYNAIKSKRLERESKERELRNLNDNIGPSGHQKLQVCDVCGAYLSKLDNDRRLADHFGGKMHLGYATMRALHKELQEKISARGPIPTGPSGGGPRGGRDYSDGYRGGSDRRGPREDRWGKGGGRRGRY
ncbi:hypothetical protein BZA70DRAFT_279172 [Myxozyma melibiosi]|uniref:Uncharacterized protein n=1 Tax=Myxozyma melibiosi TaxID=54550 RepID=A0ABR1F5M8_9ASCO